MSALCVCVCVSENKHELCLCAYGYMVRGGGGRGGPLKRMWPVACNELKHTAIFGMKYLRAVILALLPTENQCITFDRLYPQNTHTSHMYTKITNPLYNM